MLTSLRGIRCLLWYRLFVSHYLFWLAPDKSQKRNDPLLLQCFCFHVYFYDCLKDNRDRLRRSLEIKLLTNVPNHILGYLAFTHSKKHSVQTQVMLLFFLLDNLPNIFILLHILNLSLHLAPAHTHTLAHAHTHNNNKKSKAKARLMLGRLFSANTSERTNRFVTAVIVADTFANVAGIALFV